MSAPPQLTVVVVNWNLAAELLSCLRSVYDAGGDEAQVVVVDNGSEDDSVALVRRELPAVEVIENGANLGFAEGCNRGIAVARGEWVFALNNDARLLGDGVVRLSTLSRAVPADVGMLQPKILLEHEPHYLNSTGLVVRKNGFGFDRDFARVDRGDREGGEVFCCTAGAGLYRKEMLDAVALETGIFDRTFFMYCEDLDLGWRCRLAGWRALYEPSVRIAHRRHASSQRHGAGWPHRQARVNRVRSLVKNASARTIAAAALGLVKNLAQDALAHGRGGDYARAWRDAWPQRAAVSALVKVPRRQLEARWLS